MSFGATTKTLNDVIEEIRRTFGDESSIQVTDNDIIRWTNAAQREILINNRILRATGTTVSVADQAAYNITDLKIVAIQSIHYKNNKVEYRSFQEAEEFILQTDPDRTSRGTPEIWYEWGGTINFYPVPDSSDEVITVYYVKEPEPVSVDSPALSVPDSYYENVIQYVMSRAYELDEDMPNAQVKRGEFAERLTLLGEQEATPQQDFYPVITELAEDSWYGN